MVVVSLLLMASLAAAFALLNDGAGGKEGTGPITVMDDRGKNVTMAKAPEKIVSLGSAFTEIIFDLNSSEKLVGVDASSMWLVEGAGHDIADLGSVSSLSVESVLALNADCVVIWNFNMYQTLIGNLENVNIAVLAFYPKNVTGILSTITVLGTAIGEKDKAVDMVAEMQEIIDGIVLKTSSVPEDQKPRVYLELKSMDGQTVGSGTMSDQLIAMAGGVNIFNDRTGNWRASPESIVGENPTVIIIEDQSSKTNDRLALELGPSVDAVKSDKIYRIDGSTLTTSPGVVKALQNMAKWFHPELFD